ncbi:hypothetical protein ACH5RR_038929 [Cinchona calisaya]|uniref:Uncharacterized protein n=1 Tax=Cinchona calisaya TaxID=153742 RepID=A0ABD2XWQ8_9GENT
MADATVDLLKSTYERVSSGAAAKSGSKTQAKFVVIDQNQVIERKRSSRVKNINGNATDAHVIDGLDCSIKDELLPRSKWHIFRVPGARHQADHDDRGPYYTPWTVSIGPIHYKKCGMEIMEAHKLRFLHRLLDKYGEPSSMLKSMEEAMRGLEQKTRDCYSEEFPHIDRENFTKMMLLDGCYQIELFRMSGRRSQGKLADDPIFETNWMPIHLGRDMLLLENQLPLFVLQELFELTSQSNDDGKASLSELALHFFEPFRPGKDATEIEQVERNATKQPHLLALFHSSFSPSTDSIKPPREIKRVNNYNTYPGKCWFYNAKLLENCGVKFTQKSGNILDIKFKKKDSAFHIPTIFLDESTTLVLRNLVAYEQSDRRVAPYFTYLVVFFSNLLHSPIDAEVLLQAGIIRQTNNNRTQVVDLFCSLGGDLHGFDMDNCYLHRVIDVVNSYTNSRWARIKAFPINHKPSFQEIILLFLALAVALFTAGQTKTNQTVAYPSPSSSHYAGVGG